MVFGNVSALRYVSVAVSAEYWCCRRVLVVYQLFLGSCVPLIRVVRSIGVSLSLKYKFVLFLRELSKIRLLFCLFNPANSLVL